MAVSSIARGARIQPLCAKADDLRPLAIRKSDIQKLHDFDSMSPLPWYCRFDVIYGIGSRSARNAERMPLTFALNEGEPYTQAPHSLHAASTAGGYSEVYS